VDIGLSNGIIKGVFGNRLALEGRYELFSKKKELFLLMGLWDLIHSSGI